MAYLDDTIKTGVKFYASLTRLQAKDLATKTIFDEKGNKISDANPGAVCFVSDKDGNSIFLNGLLFGDGAKSSGGSSGGGGGLTEVKLSDIAVVKKDGKSLTLADYFNSNGDFVTEGIKFYNTNVEGQQIEALSITKEGITIGTDVVVTQTVMTSAITSNNSTLLATAQDYADTAETNAKTYAESLLSSVYKFKGTVNTYNDLTKLTSVQAGDVYNVKSASGSSASGNYTPPGTNYAYVSVGDEDDPQYPGYWDALGGTLDVTGFIDQATLNLALLNTLKDAKDYADGIKTDINNDISTQLNSVNAAIQANAESIATNAKNIKVNIDNTNTNTTNINNIASQLTWQ